jgi:hypothetical protein
MGTGHRVKETENVFEAYTCSDFVVKLLRNFGLCRSTVQHGRYDVRASSGSRMRVSVRPDVPVLRPDAFISPTADSCATNNRLSHVLLYTCLCTHHGLKNHQGIETVAEDAGSESFRQGSP